MSSPRVFVSYARSDGADAARVLRQRLTAHRLSVWQDLADLEGGDDWWRQIADAIAQVEYVVLVLTPAALDSQVVRDEWRFARRCGVCVIPVLGSPGLDLSRLPPWMRRTHVVDVDDAEQWTRFALTLQGPCRTVRVPQMAEPPPADFVDRPREFEALRQMLTTGPGHAAVAISASLRGAGGFGKTTLARALCHDLEILEAYYDGVLWVTLGENPANIPGILEDLLVTLTGQPSGLSSVAARRSRLAEILADRSVLMVIDDVWSATHLHPFLVGGERCAWLITTRDSQTLPRGTREVRVDAMEASESVALLQSGLRDAGTAALTALAARLGEWPLLLKLVLGMALERVERARDTPAGAVEYVNRLLDKGGVTAFDARDPVQRSEAIALTIESSLRRLSADERRRFQELAVFPEDVAVPVAAVAALWQRTGGLDRIDTEQHLQTLLGLSLLLDCDFARQRMRLHDVIRAYLLAEVGAGLPGVHRHLVEAYRTHCPGGWHTGPDDEYFFHHLPSHLAAADGRAELRGVLLDPRWIEAKARRTGIDAVLNDYRAWEADPVVHLVAEALTLAADIIDKDPEAVTPQLLGRIAAEGRRELAELLFEWRTRRRAGPWLCPDGPTLENAGGALVRLLPGPVDSSRCYGVSDDGRYAALARDGASVVDLRQGRTVYQVRAETAALTRNGRFLAVGISSGVELYDPSTGQCVWWTSCRNLPIVAVAATDDGRRVAALAGIWSRRPVIGADSVHVWDVQLQRELFTQERDNILRVAISTDGRRVFLNFPGGMLEAWDVDSGRRLQRAVCPETDVRTIVAGASPDVLVIGTRGGTVQVWNVADDFVTAPVPGRDVEGTAVAVTPTGRAVAVGFYDGRAEWHVLDGPAVSVARVGGELSQWTGDSAVTSVGLTADASQLLTTSRDGTVRVWRRPPSTLQAPSAWTEAGRVVGLTPDGDRLLLQRSGGPVSVHDVATGRVLVWLHTQRDLIADVITPDGRWLACGSPSGGTDVWDLLTGEFLGDVPTQPSSCALFPARARVACVLPHPIHPWRQVLQVGGFDAGVWRAEESSPPFDRANVFEGIVAAPDRERVLAVTAEIVLWDFTSGVDERLELDSFSFQDRCRGIRAAGGFVVLASYSRAVVLGVSARRELLAIDVEPEHIASYALCPDTGRVIVASGRTARVWNVARGVKEAAFHADAAVAAVAATGAGRFVVVSADGRIHRLELKDAGSG